MHIPVMHREVINLIKPTMSKRILDATFGRGGHTRMFLQHGAHVTACDRDIDAYYTGLSIANNVSNLTMHRGCFTRVGHQLMGEKFDGILLDLGMCSAQIADAKRGFSFNTDGPLDMRMGDSKLSAFELVNYGSYDILCSIIRDYGEERMYKKIVKRIIEKRDHKLFSTTKDLSDEIMRCVRYANKHPATRTFQALRIFINNELNELRHFLSIGLKLLKPHGTMTILSFHSLEDRIVKRFFNKSKQKLFPQIDEKKYNPRSRSAVLRYITCV